MCRTRLVSPEQPVLCIHVTLTNTTVLTRLMVGRDNNLIVAGTVEEKIMELQERKLKMLGAIIEQPDSALKTKASMLTVADWTALLS